MKKAFTLAEVLITLVIIGVVAALTLPTLMTKYQQHVFENQFKKSLYTISQIVAQARTNLGVSRLGAYCTEYTKEKGYYNSNECVTEINEYIKKVKKQQFGATTFYTINRNNKPLKTYNNNDTVFTNGTTAAFSLVHTNLLADGSFLSFKISNAVLYFGIDLNGDKKPNRWGYDVFVFSLNNKNDAISGFLNSTPTNVSDNDAKNYADTYYKDSPYRDNYEQLYGTPCNLYSTRESNGIGCAYYALRNKCPYDDTKTYWECLK